MTGTDERPSGYSIRSRSSVWSVALTPPIARKSLTGSALPRCVAAEADERIESARGRRGCIRCRRRGTASARAWGTRRGSRSSRSARGPRVRDGDPRSAPTNRRASPARRAGSINVSRGVCRGPCDRGPTRDGTARVTPSSRGSTAGSDRLRAHVARGVRTAAGAAADRSRTRRRRRGPDRAPAVAARRHGDAEGRRIGPRPRARRVRRPSGRSEAAGSAARRPRAGPLGRRVACRDRVRRPDLVRGRAPRPPLGASPAAPDGAASAIGPVVGAARGAAASSMGRPTRAIGPNEGPDRGRAIGAIPAERRARLTR